MTTRDLDTPAFGPEPGEPPYQGRNLRAAHRRGWIAASYGGSVNGNPYKSESLYEAWRTGHAAYHQWLQAHRVRACDRVEAA